MSCARPLEPSGDDVAILCCIVKPNLRCAVACDNIWMATSDVKGPAVPSGELGTEHEEAVEMKSSIAVIFSSNDTLSSKIAKMFNNEERIKASALCVREEPVLCIETKFLACVVLRHLAEHTWAIR